MNNFILTLSMFWSILSPNASLKEFKQLTINRDFDQAYTLSCLINPKRIFVDDRHSYYVYRAVCEHQLGLLKETKNSIQKYNEQFGNISERDKALIFLIEEDLKTWEDNPLGQITRKMKKAEDRLSHNRGGPATQLVQKEIIKDLDKIIKDMEDEKNKASQQANSNSDGDGTGKDGGGPLKDSKIMPGNGKGEVDLKKLEKVARQWGKLPEKQRAAAMQEITRNMPAKYRETIEAYFLKLARDDKNEK